jgi:hypothetical protein
MPITQKGIFVLTEPTDKANHLLMADGNDLHRELTLEELHQCCHIMGDMLICKHLSYFHFG